MNNNEFEIQKAPCSNCGRETNHFLIASRTHPITKTIDKQFEMTWINTYNMLECCGCSTTHLEHQFWYSEMEQGELEIHRFPPTTSRRQPPWHDHLSDEEYALFKEVYTALHADSRRLAVMGTRTLLDIFMTKHVGDIGGFEIKLKALLDAGKISRVDKSILEAALDAGHAAAHRGHCPSIHEVNYVLDIIENLFQGEILKTAAQVLRVTTPRRKA